MFQITQYLQFRNTSDGKPRVLREVVDYDMKAPNNLYHILHKETVANLSDCRPLLSVEIELGGNYEKWLEGDIYTFRHLRRFDGIEKGDQEGDLGIAIFNYFDSTEIGLVPDQVISRLGNFFDDPKKYSKTLWDCSEEEGWKKVYKLLDIEL